MESELLKCLFIESFNCKLIDMPYTFLFEKLNVWIDSKELIKLIYIITKEFPNEEKFGLTSQLRRTPVSVASNIAEGTSRSTNKRQGSFFNNSL